MGSFLPKPMPGHLTQQAYPASVIRNCLGVDHSISCVGTDGSEDNDSSLAEMSGAFRGKWPGLSENIFSLMLQIPTRPRPLCKTGLGEPACHLYSCTACSSVRRSYWEQHSIHISFPELTHPREANRKRSQLRHQDNCSQRHEE